MTQYETLTVNVTASTQATLTTSHAEVFVKFEPSDGSKLSSYQLCMTHDEAYMMCVNIMNQLDINS